MRNCDLWSEDEVVPMFEKFCRLSKCNADEKDREKALVHWLMKASNDAALAYEIGSLVRVKVSGRVSYAVVECYVNPFEEALKEDICYQMIVLRFADGTRSRYRVYGKSLGRNDVSDMKDGEIRLSDIPEDVIRLMMPRCGFDVAIEPLRDKCPFKDEFKTPMPPCATGGLSNAQ